MNADHIYIRIKLTRGPRPRDAYFARMMMTASVRPEPNAAKAPAVDHDL